MAGADGSANSQNNEARVEQIRFNAGFFVRCSGRRLDLFRLQAKSAAPRILQNDCVAVAALKHASMEFRRVGIGTQRVYLLASAAAQPDRLILVIG